MTDPTPGGAFFPRPLAFARGALYPAAMPHESTLRTLFIARAAASTPGVA